MADWTVERIKAEIRTLTARPSTSQLSESDLLNRINDFYREVFPQEVMVNEFEVYFDFSTVDGTGTKTLAALATDNSLTAGDIINVHGPVYSDGDEINFWTDDQLYFDQYPHSNTDESEPEDILLFNNTLYLRPIPDAVYTIRVKSTAQKPAAFTDNSDTPDDNKWGEAIAYGVAIKILADSGQDEAAAKKATLYRFHIGSIARKRIQQMPLGKRSQPRF